MNYQDKIEKLWCDAWLAAATSVSTTSVGAPGIWADKAIEQFKERFPEKTYAPFVKTDLQPEEKMCKPQAAQINCMLTDCMHNQGNGYCSHAAPQFLLYKPAAENTIVYCNCHSFKETID